MFRCSSNRWECLSEHKHELMQWAWNISLDHDDWPIDPHRDLGRTSWEKMSDPQSLVNRWRKSDVSIDHHILFVLFVRSKSKRILAIRRLTCERNSYRWEIQASIRLFVRNRTWWSKISISKCNEIRLDGMIWCKKILQENDQVWCVERSNRLTSSVI